MDEVVAARPGNPEAWGRKAQLLFQNDRVEEAEAALQKALDISPKYPFGHMLRGMFRYHEGEIPAPYCCSARPPSITIPRPAICSPRSTT